MYLVTGPWGGENNSAIASDCQATRASWQGKERGLFSVTESQLTREKAREQAK